jgi:hypothetical protein
LTDFYDLRHTVEINSLISIHSKAVLNDGINGIEMLDEHLIKLRSILKQIAGGFGIIILSFQYSFGTTFYVRTTGNDVSGDGSADNPWKTLKYASTRVAPGQGHIIQLSAGIFIENGPIEIPLGVSLEGAGINQTIFKASSSFYYYPADPGYAPEKFLIRLSEFNPSNGNQTLRNFTVDGDSKKLHGGVFVRYRSNVVIENINVQYTNYSGIWLWDVKDSRIKNIYLTNCSWGSYGYSAGALNLGNLERVEVDQIDINEQRGYGIKALGPDGYNNIFQLKIHNSHISVNPAGLWSGGRAPNIAIELWLVNLVGCEIYNCYVDNNISLVNANAIPSTGIQTIRVHHNIIDLETRANGAGYGMELTVHDAEVDHNYFIKGAYGIVNWDNPMQNWIIHHNVFYGQQGQYPGEIVRSQWSGLQNVKLFNNTIEFIGDKTMSVIGLYGGTSNNIEMRNNLVINSSTGYSFFPHEVIHTENGASINNLIILNNSTDNLKLGSLLESLLSILGIIVWTPEINLSPLPNPTINNTGNKPEPYYFPNSGSSLIDRGTYVGFPFLGSAPDIGAYEFGAIVTPNSPPWINLTNPLNGSIFSTGTSIILDAIGSDSDGTISKVEFFNGTTKLGEDLTSPYSYVWTNVPTGSYVLTSKITDNKAAVTTSSPINISVTNTNSVPVVTITSPANNSSFTAGSNITITAAASDSDGAISKVEFFNGATKLGEDLTGPYSYDWSNVLVGSYSLTVKATDNIGAVTTSSPINISVTNPNSVPVVTITSPANNSSFTAGSNITIGANASDNDGTITKVEFFNGATKLGEDSSSPYSFVWNNVIAGSYVLSATAIDNIGALSTSTAVSISVNNPNNPPTVTITSPGNNSSFTSGSTITITADAADSDGIISKVQFFRDTIKLGEDLISPYSFDWTNVLSGNYQLTVSSIDNQNAVTVSPSVAIVVIDSRAKPITLYPNPASSKFTIEYLSDRVQQIMLKILDMNSRLITHQIATIKEGHNSIEMDVQLISNGLYIVSLEASNGDKFSIRLIVLH